MKLQFNDNGWTTDEFAYAYSYRFDQTPVFTPCGDHVENRADNEACYGYENISLLSRKLLPPGTTVTTRCAFLGDAAPLIVLAKAMDNVDGVFRYGDYVEVVLYKNGVNVWKMKRENGKVTWVKRMAVEFPVSEGDIHTLSVTYTKNTLDITADDRVMSLYMDDLYGDCHVGINACEGINRFYSLEVTPAEE